MLYTTDDSDTVTSFNLIGAEDNILSTSRTGADGASDFYVYTKDIRESTTNIIGKDGTAQVSYTYDEYGETTEHQKDAENPFYNEICYTAGVYDDTTKLYYLNARYYSPEAGTFLTQDTYRGSRSRTSTLNYYAYCAGNPISYTDPTGHWVWAAAGAAMGAYDGYKYAKKKNLKGWKKAAAIAGGALLGAVNPFKVVKAVKTGYKAYKASKYVKKAATAKKTTKAASKAISKPKVTTVSKNTVQVANKPKAVIQSTKVAKTQAKTAKAACFVAGTKIHTDKGFKDIEHIKPGDYVWSENPETHEKALKKVKKIFVREKDSIIRLSINGEVIETTDEHPFYVEGRGFTEAQNLKAGEEVRTADGSFTTVDSIESIRLDKPVKVYNFEVKDFHTYYVSEQKVLVHNTCAVTENAYDYYKKLVETLDVTTKPNTAVFYSGKGNRELAETFAKNNGKTTLEMTPGGRTLEKLDLFGDNSPLTRKQAYDIWGRLSRRYAEGASGNVYGFVKGAKPDSIFNMVEYPILKSKRNTAVTNMFTELME